MHDVNRTLLTMLDNQVHRTRAALDELPERIYEVRPGGDCKSIREIGEHLVTLRRFQLQLLESSRAAEVADPKSASATLEALRAALEEAADHLRAAIEAHDSGDWLATPTAPREGLWGELPTLLRFVRPFNDFVNHLGAIRAIRRIHGHGADRTQ